MPSFDYYNRIEKSNFVLANQVTVPSCGTPPVGCTLAFVSITTNDVTLRGGNDGSITVVVSGATGATANMTYSLNGTVYTTAGSLTTYTFSSLEAGIYNIYVGQANQTCYIVSNNNIVQDGEFRTGNFIVNSPSNLVAVENPIIVGVSTAINDPSPSPSTTVLEVISNLSEGYNIKFNITSPYVYTNTFNSKGYPNKNNYFLSYSLKDASGIPQGNNSQEEIATSLAEALQSDVLLPKLYYINNSGTKVTLQAKENGSKLNLDATNVLCYNAAGTQTNSGITVTQSIIGTDFCDGQISDNYSISCEVLVNTDTTNQYPDIGDVDDYNRIAELVLPFSQNNIHKFDISSIIKTQVSTPQPDINLTGSTLLPTMMQPYYVKLSELYPLIPNTNTIKKRYKTSTSVNWAINSSLNRLASNNMSSYLGVSGGTGYTDVLFLTNSPNPKQIQRDSNEFLYFILRKDYGATLKVKGDLYFYDGTSATGQTFFTITTGTTNAGGCMVMNLSYDKLGLEAYEVSGTTQRKIKRAEIAVYQNFGQGDIQYTEVKKYRFEIDEQPRKFGILFQNSLGAFDSYDMVGVVETNISRVNSTYTVPLNINQDGSLSDGFRSNSSYDTKITRSVTCNSGWIDLAHFDWLQELLASNFIYSTTTENQNYLLLKDFKYTKSSLDDLYDCEFTFEWTIYENNMTV